MKEQLNYSIINHNARIELNLTANEYLVADLIFNLSNNPKSPKNGWCYASKETLGTYLGLSKQSVHTIINKLIELSLVEKDPETKFLCTTSKWFEAVLIKKDDSKESLPIVKKVYSHSKESLLQHSKESLHNNDIYNNDITNSTNVLLAKADKSKSEINKLFEYWEQQVGYKIQSKIKQNRFACSNLIKKYGFNKTQKLIDGVTLVQQDRYGPGINDFCDLQSKTNALIAWGKKKHNGTLSVGRGIKL